MATLTPSHNDKRPPRANDFLVAVDRLCNRTLSTHCGSPHEVIVAPGVILPSRLPLVPGGIQSDPKRLRGGRM